MDESLVSKQDYAEAIQIVSMTSRKHDPTSALQISTILDHHGPAGGCFGDRYSNQNSFSQWLKA
jgi:hypothetical protein